MHGVLQMNAAIRLGQDHPQYAVREEADSGEDSNDDEETPHKNRVDSPTVCKTGGNAAGPSVRTSDNAEAADPTEEIRV